MRSEHAVDPARFAPAIIVDDAVGIHDAKHWYVAIVNNHSEVGASMKLAALGYESYVPVQVVDTKWKNGRKNRYNRVVLPAMVFVHTTENERKRQIVNLPFIKRFMVDRSAKKSFPVAVIPDLQMQSFMFMVDHAEEPVEMVERTFGAGDRVKVTGGRLAGLEGVVRLSADGKSRILVDMDILGCASVEIEKTFLERI